MGDYAEIHAFKASESNLYDDYFDLSTEDWSILRSAEKKQEVYKERLDTASKNKLIDIAIEGHQNYKWANNLAYDRGLEIEQLKKDIETLKTKHATEITLYNNIAYNSKVACFVTIGVCALVIGFFYIYQYIKFRLKKYADKIRTETIEEIKHNQ